MGMEINVKNIKGESVRKISLPDSVFGVEMNEHVLHTVVKAYAANRRQGTHATKTRTNVSGGGKKPFKQKGTGQARQGSSRSPLNPGGGTAHGPQPRDYSEKTNVKLRQLALRVALSDKVRHGKFVVVDDFKVSKFSTKHIIAALKALGVTKALLADERKDLVLYRSARNIHGTESVMPGDLNAEQVLRHESLVVTETALNVLQQRLEEKKRERA
jgi:large subunit ribosomal protein L4